MTSELSLDPLQTKHLQSSHFLDEANRQIANHLAMLAALLRVRAKSFGQMHKPMTGEDVQFVLEEFAGRLETVGKLNRGLASMANGPPVDIAEYLADIAQGLVSSLTVKGQIALDCEFPVTCVLSVEQAATLGLMIGNLITDAGNTLIPRRRRRHPTGNLKRDDATIPIEVSDDGVGLPTTSTRSGQTRAFAPSVPRKQLEPQFRSTIRPSAELPAWTSLHLARP